MEKKTSHLGLAGLITMRMDTRIRASTVPVIFYTVYFNAVFLGSCVNKLILEVFILTKTEGVISILITMAIITKHAENIWKNFFPVGYNYTKLCDWYLSP